MVDVRVVGAIVLIMAIVSWPSAAQAQSRDWTLCQEQSSTNHTAKIDACARIVADASQTRHNRALALRWRSYQLLERARSVEIVGYYPGDEAAASAHHRTRVAALQRQLADLNQAAADYDRSVELQTERQLGEPIQGLVFRIVEERRWAEEALARGMPSRGDRIQPHRVRCSFLNETYQRVLEHCELVINYAPDASDKADAAANLGRLHFYEHLGRRDLVRARREIARAIGFEANNQRANELGAQLEYEERNYTAALEHMRRLVAGRHGVTGVQALTPYTQALIHARNTNTPNTDAIIEAWEGLFPESARWPSISSTYNARCWNAAVAGRNLQQAQRDCDRAIFHSGARTASFLDSRGLVRLKLGDNEGARADYSAAVALQNSAHYRYGLSIALRRLGRVAEADAERAAAVAAETDIASRYTSYAVRE